MAITNDRSTTTTAFELNYYDDSMQDLFGTSKHLGLYSVGRQTTYWSDMGRTTYNLTHTKDLRRIQVAAESKVSMNNHTDKNSLFRYHPIDRPYLPYRLAINLGTGDQIVNESPGYYRVLYNWQESTWTTEIAGIKHENGSFLEGQHLHLSPLDLQVPNVADYADNCLYEPFLRMYRGNGSVEQLEKQGNRTARDNGGVVLRTAAFGIEQGELQMCAQRRDILSENGEIVLKGLGPTLPVVVGMLASLRYNGWKAGARGDCSWHS